MVLVKNLKLILKKSLDLIYPLNCLICRKKLNFNDGSYLCSECYAQIIKNKPPFCVKCDCSPLYFERAWSVSKYTGIIKDLIHLFKYRRQKYLAKPLGKLMIEFINTNLNWQTIDALVPVPLHPKKLRQREFNQAELLAKEINRQIPVPITNALMRIKQTSSQTTLPPEKRFSNIAGAFKIRDAKEVAQKSILLIDDVLTSGATANECSRVLKQEGAKRIEILTLAGR
ncbi:MAG: ComF family protein [Candidatus Omnitrophica bacterium]|nr:ComF family protein [Candidatus Omnitrophota bacterium]